MSPAVAEAPSRRGDASPIEAAGVYLELAKLAHSSFEGRRQVELRVSVTAWVLILLSALWLPLPDFPLSVFWVAGAFLFVTYVFWLRGIWRANQIDKQARDYYRAAAEDSVGGKLDPIPAWKAEDARIGIWAFLCDWSIRSQIIATALFLAFAIALITHPAANNTTDTQDADDTVTAAPARI